jgi:hypothetical protein
VVVIAHQRWSGAVEQQSERVNALIIVLACLVLGITPFAVYWNYRQDIRNHEITPYDVRSAIPHEYFTPLRDDYLG